MEIETRIENKYSNSDRGEDDCDYESNIKYIRNDTRRVINASVNKIKRGTNKIKYNNETYNEKRTTNDKNKSRRDTNKIEKEKSIRESAAKSCRVHQLTENNKTKYETTGEPKLIINIIGPVQEELKEDRYLLMTIDTLVNKTKLYTVRNKNIDKIINKIRIKYFERYGKPIEIITERKKRYRTKEWRDFAKEIGFSSRMITTNDNYDRLIKKLRKIIITYVRMTHEKWENVIECVRTKINRAIDLIKNTRRKIDNKSCKKDWELTNKYKTTECKNIPKYQNNAIKKNANRLAEKYQIRQVREAYEKNAE